MEKCCLCVRLLWRGSAKDITCEMCGEEKCAIVSAASSPTPAEYMHMTMLQHEYSWFAALKSLIISWHILTIVFVFFYVFLIHATMMNCEAMINSFMADDSCSLADNYAVRYPRSFPLLDSSASLLTAPIDVAPWFSRNCFIGHGF